MTGKSRRTRKKRYNSKVTSSSIYYNIFVIIILLVVSIPLASNFIYWQSSQKTIDHYETKAAESTSEEIANYFSENTLYNEDLADSQNLIFEDPYHSLVTPNSKVEGSLYLPKLSLTLPIFAGSQTGVMKHGFTLLENSSLLGGGNNTHTVLVDYRGLLSNRWFYNMQQLRIGDRLYINVMGERIAYQINQIETVQAGDIQSLAIQPGHDYLTVITRPLKDSDERLLIRSNRTDYVPTVYESDQRINHSNNMYRLLFYLSSVVLLILIIYLIDSFIKKRS